MKIDESKIDRKINFSRLVPSLIGLKFIKMRVYFVGAIIE